MLIFPTTAPIIRFQRHKGPEPDDNDLSFSDNSYKNQKGKGPSGLALRIVRCKTDYFACQLSLVREGRELIVIKWSLISFLQSA